MEVVDILFRGNTKDVDKKLDDVAKAAKRAQYSAAELDGALNRVGRLGGPIGDIASKVGSLGEGAATAASASMSLASGVVLIATAAAAAGTAVVHLALSVAAAADKFKDLSDRTNISAERLSLLDAMAKNAGSSADELVSSSEALGMKLAKQDEEAGKAVTALKELGVSTKTASGETKSLLKLQEDIVLAVDAAGNSAKAQGAAVQLLGAAYFKLRTPIREAAQEQSVMYDYMKNTGSLVSTKLAKDSDTLNDNIAKLSLGFKGMANSIGTVVIPVLNTIVESITTITEKAAALVRRYSGGSTGSEVATSTLDNLRTRLEMAERQRAGFDKNASGPIVDRNAALIASLKEQIALAEADVRTAKSAEARAKTAAMEGAPGEGNKVAGKAAKPDDPTSTPEYKEAMRIAQERQRLRIAEDESIRHFEVSQMQAHHAALVRKQEDEDRYHLHLMEAGNKLDASERERIAKERAGLMSLIDPNFQIIQQLEHINELERQGIATATEATTARGILSKQIVYEKQTFLEGWTGAFEEYKKNSMTAAQAGQKAFETAASSMTDAMTTFAMTGKLSFSSLANSIIRDLIRIAMQKAIVGFVGSIFGGSTGGAVGAAATGVGATPYAEGTNYVPYDGQLATLHEGEAVVPRKYNPAAGGQAPGSTGGSSITINTPINVNFNGDAGSEQDRNKLTRELVTTVQTLIRKELTEAQRSGGQLNPIRGR